LIQAAIHDALKVLSRTDAEIEAAFRKMSSAAAPVTKECWSRHQ
jgi:hypothetical protein